MGYEPTISAGERPQTYTFDRAATEVGCGVTWAYKYSRKKETVYVETFMHCDS
jgi:hypothetical protein